MKKKYDPSNITISKESSVFRKPSRSILRKIIILNAKNVCKMIGFDNPNLEEFNLSFKHTGILATMVLKVLQGV